MQDELDQRPAPDSGVDVTLIDWMLDMSPAERLEALQSFVNAVWRARATDEQA